MKSSLEAAIIEQLGYSEDRTPEEEEELAGVLSDIARGGADAGWHGFTYYYDTIKFHDENEDDIWDSLSDDADEMGAKNVMEFIASFNGAKNVHDMGQLKNLLAWYALESYANENS